MEESTEAAVVECLQARVQKGPARLSTAKNKEAKQFRSLQKEGKRIGW